MIWILKIDCFSLVRQLRNRENTGFADADAYIYVSELYVLVMNFLWGENMSHVRTRLSCLLRTILILSGSN